MAPHDFRVGGTGISGLAFSEERKTQVGFPAEWKRRGLPCQPHHQCDQRSESHSKRGRIDRIETAAQPLEILRTNGFVRKPRRWLGRDASVTPRIGNNKIISHNEVNTAHPDCGKSHGHACWRIRACQPQKPRKALDLPGRGESREALIRHLSSPYVLEQRGPHGANSSTVPPLTKSSPCWTSSRIGTTRSSPTTKVNTVTLTATISRAHLRIRHVSQKP